MSRALENLIFCHYNRLMHIVASWMQYLSSDRIFNVSKMTDNDEDIDLQSKLEISPTTIGSLGKTILIETPAIIYAPLKFVLVLFNGNFAPCIWPRYLKAVILG